MGFFPEGKDGEKFRRDMRMFGMASGFFTSAGFGIFCAAKFLMAAAPAGSSSLWAIGAGLGAAGAVGSILDLRNSFKTASNSPAPPQPPSSPKPPVEPPSLSDPD